MTRFRTRCRSPWFRAVWQIAVLGFLAIWFGSYWIATEGHWRTGFIRIDGGHFVMVRHGSAPWMHGVWRTSAPNAAWHRIDPVYDESQWNIGIAWQIANTSYFRTVVPLWAPFVGLFVLIFVRRLICHRVLEGHCPHCGYNLTANTSGRCPECGTPTSP